MVNPDPVFAAAGRLGAAQRHGGDVEGARRNLTLAQAKRLQAEADALVASAGPPTPEEPT